MQRSQLLNIVLVVFIVMLGFGLIMPLIPYYGAQYGASDFLLGLLMATYAMMQFVGAPLLGRLSDRLGRRPLLVVSMAGTAFGFLLLGLADPLGRGLAALLSANPTLELQNAAILGVMFFSRMISGLTGGVITVANAYIADVTDERNRTQGMGMLGAAFGLSFILGPVIGGVLSQWGYAVPAFVAAGLAALNLGTVTGVLKESLTDARKAELARQPKRPLVSLPAMMKSLSMPRLGPLLTIRMFVSLAGALFMALFTLWTKNQLGLDAQATSYLMAYNGILSIIIQMGFIGPLTKRFSDASLITWSIVFLALSLLGWAFTPNVPVLMVVLVPMAVASAVLNTVVASATTWAVPPNEIGDALGTASAFESLSRVVAPTVGGWLLGAVGMWAPGALGAAILAGLAAFAWQRLIIHPDPPLPAPVWLEPEGSVDLPAAQLDLAK